MKWFWSRTKKRQGVTPGCLMPCESLMAAPAHTFDWTGPRAAISHQNPLANYVHLLFEAAQEKEADTVELALDQAKGFVRAQMRGSGDWQQVGGPPDFTWSGLLFTCLEIAAIESCQGTIQDPASGAQWRFMFRKEGNQIRLSKLAAQDAEEIRQDD